MNTLSNKIDPVDIRHSHILIVDAQDSNLHPLAQLLEQTGFTQVETTSATSVACNLHLQRPVDLILLDLQKSANDGFALLEALKANPVAGAPAVIAIAAQSGHKLKALQHGARDVLTSPLDEAELLARIHNTLEAGHLCKRLGNFCMELEALFSERTAELLATAAQYRSLTDLASDWHWEQNALGTLTKATGPARDLLDGRPDVKLVPSAKEEQVPGGWDADQQAELLARIEARRPFLDFELCRTLVCGAVQRFRVSGEPCLDRWNRYVGYRGVGTEIEADA